MSAEITRIYRGGLVESIHRGSIAVVDSAGSLLAFLGDPALRSCLRSAAKPFQAIPLLEYGGVAEYELSGEEIALTCASHGGEPIHVSTAAALLRKGEFDEEDLRCGVHMPFDEKAAAELRSAGETPTPLHNNCSGKHAGMLLASQAMDVAPAGYNEPDHALQQTILATVADFSGVPIEEIGVAVDGCTVPAFYLPLYRSALAYARLMATSQGEAAIGALPRYVESVSSVVEAMTTFPEYVAGNWSITTPLMAAFGGDLLAKEGAEGFYGMALAPALAAELSSRLHVAEGRSIGIAMKVEDGSMSRGRNAAIVRLLEQLGLNLEARSPFDRWRNAPIRNLGGTVVGEIRSEFELEVL